MFCPEKYPGSATDKYEFLRMVFFLVKAIIFIIIPAYMSYYWGQVYSYNERYWAVVSAREKCALETSPILLNYSTECKIPNDVFLPSSKHKPNYFNYNFAR